MHARSDYECVDGSYLFDGTDVWYVVVKLVLEI